MEDYDKIKKTLAVAFMNVLDANRPEGKMCLSNGECADIEKAFNEQDWSKLARYLDKYTESEDERIRRILIEVVNITPASIAVRNKRELLDWLEKQKEQKPVEEIKDQRQIYFMIEDGRRCGMIEGRKQVIDNPEMYGLQKPAEWSEVDRLTLDSIIAVVEEWEDTQSDKEKAYYGATTKSDWLKSLRPSWKPSEEQMKALRLEIGYLESSPGEHSIAVEMLSDLYNDLKKL